jgi:sulfur-carrier protein
MTLLKFTPNLKRFYPQLESMEVMADTLPKIIDIVDRKHPGLKSYILDEQGQLRKHVHIFIGENQIKDRLTLSDPVSNSDQVYIMQALSGG